MGEGFARPFCVDMDGDGKVDCLVGTGGGLVEFHLNTGTEARPAWTKASSNFFAYDVGDLASPWCGEVFSTGRIDCFVGALDGKVHFFQRTGGAYTASYSHVSDNILPFWRANMTATSAAARGRGAFGGGGSAAGLAAALVAVGGGAAAGGAGAAAVALTAVALGSGRLLGPAPIADAASSSLAAVDLDSFDHPAGFRTAAAPFCGRLHPGANKRMECLVGTGDGRVQRYVQAAGGARGSNATEAAPFELDAASVLGPADDYLGAGELENFAAPSCSLDLDGNGHFDCVVGTANGTARLYMYYPAGEGPSASVRTANQAGGYFEVTPREGWGGLLGGDAKGPAKWARAPPARALANACAALRRGVAAGLRVAGLRGCGCVAGAGGDAIRRGHGRVPAGGHRRPGKRPHAPPHGGPDKRGSGSGVGPALRGPHAVALRAPHALPHAPTHGEPRPHARGRWRGAAGVFGGAVCGPGRRRGRGLRRGQRERIRGPVDARGNTVRRRAGPPRPAQRLRAPAPGRLCPHLPPQDRVVSARPAPPLLRAHRAASPPCPPPRRPQDENRTCSEARCVGLTAAPTLLPCAFFFHSTNNNRLNRDRDDAMKKNARGLRFKLKSFDSPSFTQVPRRHALGPRGLPPNPFTFPPTLILLLLLFFFLPQAVDFDHFTGADETRVAPGSQTTRNVCLLAFYGNKCGPIPAACSLPLPSMKRAGGAALALSPCREATGQLLR